MVIKACVICGVDFDARNSLHKTCGEACRGRQRAAYNHEHKEKIALRQRKYYQEHKEDAAAWCRKYYQEHKEDAAAYYHEHKEKIALRQRKYRQEHKEDAAAWRRERHRKIVQKKQAATLNALSILLSKGE